MKTIAVLGATGRIGTAVANAFSKHGYRVIAICRGNAVHLDETAMQIRNVDATDRSSLVNATEGADIIFNGLNPPYTKWSTNFMPLAENVLAAATTHSALHLFPGNIYNYGSPLPERLDETCPTTPTTRKGIIRDRMEKRFWQEAQAGRCRTMILRAGDFYGTAGTGSWFDLVLTAKLGKRKLLYPGPLEHTHAWAYLPDLAQTFVDLAEVASSGQAFEVFHYPGHNVTGYQMKEAIEDTLGYALKTVPLPWNLFRLGGMVVPMWREVSEMRYLWHAPHRLLSSRLHSSLPTLPATPLPVAVAKSLANLGLQDHMDTVPGIGLRVSA